MELTGASRDSLAAGQEQLPGAANYFIGNDSAKWHSGVPMYARVRYTGVYPGVDLGHYGNQRQLEYDFVVAPGASAKPIRLHFDGAARLRLTQSGRSDRQCPERRNLVHKPDIYQEINGRRRPIQGHFTLLAGNTAGFSVGNYNHALPLVIDPILAYSTYLGGSLGAQVAGIKVDASGDAFARASPIPWTFR